LFFREKVKRFKNVFDTFEKHYELVPLEVFGRNPYKTLISTILSSRTKDEVTLEASKRLFAKAQNPKSLSKLPQEDIEKLIYPVGFYKTKARHLKRTANILTTKYDGQIPQERSELEKLPGVGRKTANLVLSRAFGKPAIAVDTHVHKISNILGWVNTKTPDQTEKALVKIVPKKYWSELNKLFVSIGRQHTTKQSLIKFLKKEGLIPQEEW
jgi:endonuclease-3